MKRLKKSDWFLIIFLLVLVILSVLFLIFPEWGEWFNLSAWSDPDTASYNFETGLIIVSIACFIGALVPFPVPYTIIVGIVALQYHNQSLGPGAILLMVIVATITNAAGDFFDWVIGRGGGKLSEKKIAAEGNNEDVRPEDEPNKWAKLVYEKPVLIPFLLILFGLTPLPDSLLFMPLGVIKYSLKKTMLWNAVGKLVMLTVVALLGVYAFDFLFQLMGGGSGKYGWVSGMVVLFVSWCIMAFMLKKK